MNKLVYLLAALILVSSSESSAQVTSPVLKHASFDSQGRLLAQVTDVGPEGCYLIINAGLSSSKINTPITSLIADAASVAKNRVTLKTRRKYYCRRRSLYVQIEKSCLGDVVGSALSKVRQVNVPNSNLTR